MVILTFENKEEALAAVHYANDCGFHCDRIKLCDGWLVLAYPN